MIVVCGEGLMDVYAGASSVGGMLLDARIGGSPFNVAIGLARLNQPVAFFGALSHDVLGQRLLRALHDEGVATESVAQLHAPTTLSLVGLDDSGVPTYSFHGHGCADRLLPADALARVPASARAFHFGSYTMVIEPVAATLHALVEREHRRSLIAYDPNIRLNVEPDIQRWREVLQWMLPRTHLMKVSAEDLDLLYPTQDLTALARGWIEQGVALVVVTHGAAGVSAWTARQALRVEPVAVEVVDSVGAGDTFQAALLAALAERGVMSADALRTMPTAFLREVLGFAARAAAITCSRRGADLPRRRELD